MVANPPTLSDMPVAPDRSDRATFSIRATAVFDALKTAFVPEVNALASWIKEIGDLAETALAAGLPNASDNATTAAEQAGVATAQAVIATEKAAEAAASAASIAGGPVSSVNGHTGAVTLKTVGGLPLVGSGDIPIGAGDAVVQTISTDLVLTYQSAKVQSISATTENLCIILPDATTLPKGGALFVFENTGVYPIPLRDAAAMFLGLIYPGQVIAVYLKDNSIAEGVWAFGSMRGGELGRVLNNTATVFTPGTSFTSIRFALLTPTTGVMLWDNSTTVYRCVVTIDGTSVTFGAVTSSVLTGLSQARLIRLSDTQAICSSTNSVFALTVDGETITVGAIATQTSVTAAASGGIERLTDTTALLYYTRSSTSYATCCFVVTVTDNVCTIGAAWTSTVTGSGPVSCRAVVMSPTLAFVTYSDASGTRMYVTALSISGTTIATVTSIQVTSSVTDAVVETYGFIKLSETSALLLVGLYGSGLAANARNFRTYIVRYESSILSCDKPQFLSIVMNGDSASTFGFDAGDGVMLCRAYETPPYKQPNSSLLQLSCNGSQVVQLPYVSVLDYSIQSKDLSFLNKKGVCVGKANGTNGIAVSIIEVA